MWHQLPRLVAGDQIAETGGCSGCCKLTQLICLLQEVLKFETQEAVVQSLRHRVYHLPFEAHL